MVIPLRTQLVRLGFFDHKAQGLDVHQVGVAQGLLAGDGREALGRRVGRVDRGVAIDAAHFDQDDRVSRAAFLDRQQVAATGRFVATNQVFANLARKGFAKKAASIGQPSGHVFGFVVLQADHGRIQQKADFALGGIINLCVHFRSP